MNTPTVGRKGCCAVAVLLLAAPLVLAQTEEGREDSGARIARSAICLRVEEREPVDTGTSFRPDVGQLFAYTQVEGVTRPTRITHVWYHGHNEIYRRDLDIQDTGWRTWTSKKIDPSWTGPWRVEVLDENGGPLATLEFTIEEEGGGSGPGSGD
jgi:hypothetical protein